MAGEPPSGTPSEPDQRFRLLEEHFHRLADLSPEERRARLEELAQQQPALAEQLAELLGIEGQTWRVGAALDAVRASAAVPMPLPFEIGPYRAERVLGEGGMGVVYEGVQQRPVRRRVAALPISPMASGPGYRI